MKPPNFRQLKENTQGLWPSVETAFYLFVILSSIATAFLVATRGFDLTDDGFYYLAASLDPLKFIHNSPFALVPSVLWAIGGGHVVLFRFFGMLIMFCSALVFVMQLLNYQVTDRKRSRLFTGALAVLITGGYYSLGLPGLSYNWGSLVGLLILSGLVVGQDSFSPMTSLQKINVGLAPIGVLLILTSKWSSLVILVLGISLVGLVSGRAKTVVFFLAVVLISFATVTVGLSVWLPLEDFLQLMSRGYSQVLTLNPDYGASAALARFTVTATAHLLVGLFAFLVSVALLKLWKWFRDQGIRGGLSGVAATPETLGLIVLILSGLGMARYESEILWSSTSLVFATLIGVGFQILAEVKCSSVVSKSFFSRLRGVLTEDVTPNFWPAAVSLILSLSHAFGSANGAYNMGMSAAVFFSVIIARIPLTSFSRRALAVVSIGLLTQSFFVDAVVSPYRGSSLLTQDATLNVRGSKISVHRDVALELNQLKSCATKNGWVAGEGIYDLTSWNPGVVFFLEASVPAAILSHLRGYPGSKEYTLRVVRQEEESEVGLKFLDSWVMMPSRSHEFYSESRSIYDGVLRDIGTSPDALIHESVCMTSQWELSRPVG